MHSVLVVRVNLIDAEKWQAYATAAKPVLQEYGASVLMMDPSPVLLSQGSQPDILALVVFPSKQQIVACYQSKAYQSIIPLRDEAAETVFMAAGPLNPEAIINLQANKGE